jgi:biotin carboxylase
MVDAFGQSGIKALDRAARKYRTTFVRSPGDNENRYAGPATDEVLSRVTNVITIEDTTNEVELRKTLASVHAEAPIDSVFSTLHPVVLPLARAAHALGLRFTNVKGVERGAIKHLGRARLDECGIPSIKYVAIEHTEDLRNVADQIGFPMVVKPSGGVGKIFTQLVHTPAELAACVASYFADRAAAPRIYRRGLEGALVAEEYMRGRMVSVEVVAGNGGPRVLAIEGRRRCNYNEILELGTALPAPLAPDEEHQLRTYALDVVNALELDLGIFHIEIMLTPAGPRLIEANPRMHGAPRAMAHSIGIDVHELLVEVHLGKPIDLPALGRKPVAMVGLASSVDTVMPAVDLSWLDSYRPRLLDLMFRPKPGDKISRLRGNRDGMGLFVITAETTAELEPLATEILDRMEATLGFELARGHAGTT